jgi:hypothetical protein
LISVRLVVRIAFTIRRFYHHDKAGYPTFFSRWLQYQLALPTLRAQGDAINRTNDCLIDKGR